VTKQNAVVPFVFDRMPVRGAVVQLASEWQELLGQHDYEPALREILGHAAAATPLIAQSMKAGSSVTLQLTGDSRLSMLVMQCTSELHFRGLASASGDTTGLSFAELTRGSRCAITVDNVNSERPYQGIVEVGGESLAQSLENYFLRSAQVPSHLTLVAGESLCGGILLQQMPGEKEPLADDWRRLGYLAATLRAEDLAAGAGPGIIGKLFAEDDVRVFEARPARFQCRCSRQRAANVLKLLGEKECRLAGEGDEQIVVTCEYCGSREKFDPVDIAAIFADGQRPQSDAVH
jgi:molecular chaperone Hsp33